MSTAAQQFNVDLLVLYGTTDVYSTLGSQWLPAWREGYTDWNRRMIELPSITKEMEDWSGNFKVGQMSFSLADPYSTVFASLYGDGYPHGKPLAVYEKVSENPTQWMSVFSGLISSTERQSGLITIASEDSLRNILNMTFVPDYLNIATNIGGKLYGTVKDVIGSNVYLDDRGNVAFVKVKKDDDTGWFGAIFAGAVNAALVAASGGLWGAVVAGGALGVLGGIPSNSHKEQYYYRVTDYNAIPEGLVLGGQSLKFNSGSFDGRAKNNNGSLFNTPPVKARAGSFQYGLYGTLELDDILAYVNIGDYIYSQLPLLYRGSPDTIIVNMLTGSNISSTYSYPKDFSDDWFSQSESLRHIDAWKVIDDFDTGGIAKAIDSLAKEFGFSFYLDEQNKFAIRSIRVRNTEDTGIIGTLSEGYNVLNKGFKRTDDIKDSYTDITINFKDAIIGNVYDTKVVATMPSATYFGASRRSLTIDSQWIHDRTTAEFIATRLARKNNGILPKLSADVSLYAVPFVLGEIVSCTGWAVGTNSPYEITKYTKNYSQSIAQIEGESATYFYKKGYFICGSSGTVGATSASGFATIINTIGSLDYGTLHDPMLPSFSWNHANISFGSYIMQNGMTFILDGQEILQVIQAIPDPLHGYIDYTVRRGAMETIPEYHAVNSLASSVTQIATVFNIDPSQGTCWRWF